MNVLSNKTKADKSNLCCPVPAFTKCEGDCMDAMGA